MHKIMHVLGLLLVSASATAHDGHGFTGSHLHASDLFGFTVLAVVFGGLVWWRDRK